MPTVILVIGANGMGKTTTIGKIAGDHPSSSLFYRCHMVSHNEYKNTNILIARLHLEANATVLVAACDTYRAAAVEQLSEWSRRAQVALLAPTETERSGSPLPVLRRALQEAKDKAYDVLIVDTSGRLTNNFDLTQELIVSTWSGFSLLSSVTSLSPIPTQEVMYAIQ